MSFESIVDEIKQKAAERYSQNQGDYKVDNLLFCGKCNTPKQTKVAIFGMEEIVFCQCKCEKERSQKEEAEEQQAKLERIIEQMRKEGLYSEKLEKWTFDKDDKTNERITIVAKKYVENFAEMKKQGKGLLFYGDVGRGKTFVAACIVNALISRCIPCLMTNAPQVANKLGSTFDGKQDFIDRLNSYSLLVIDDLGGERDTEYMREIVQTAIDNRYIAGLPLIVTTNLTPEELKKPPDIGKKRLYSRLFEMCIPIEVKGVDRRREKLKSDYGKYKDILGL